MADPFHDHDHYRLLARYNRRFNACLYDACEKLSDGERKRDRGAFFGSIHGTLNHLIWGDKVWLARFAAQRAEFAAVLTPELLALPPGAVHATMLHEDWALLRAERGRLDAAIEAWVDDMTPDFPQSLMRYANTRGVQREHPAWIALSHFFNHQTHHRGQVTTLLMQAGVDPGVTDLIAFATAPA
ncbi:MAG: DinB family protein [Proteobacteria bacterium]|nr:DinB family protein [Pseudomonadota bacterium]